MENSKVVSVLNTLIEISRDGASGFKTCAEGAKDVGLKAFFQTRVRQCEEAVRELHAEVRRYGGDPDATGSITGALHRAWVNIRTAVTSNDDLAVLEECERGEDAALAAYRDALKEDLPKELKPLIQKQYEGAKENHDRVRNMRDSRKHANAA